MTREEELLYKAIAGCLKQTIDAHGSITREFIPSATKRIYCVIVNGFGLPKLAKEHLKEKYRKENEQLKRRNERLHNLVQKLMGRKNEPERTKEDT